MKKVKILASILLLTLVFSCGGGDSTKDQGSTGEVQSMIDEPEEKESDPRGIGEVKEVELSDPLNEPMIAAGESIYEMKCAACHKLSDQRVVGPGWAGITNKRHPAWIMNMITNVDVMLAEDPEAQKLLEECLTRMPNQGVSIGDARDILEFMRKNDMETVGSKDEAAKI